MIQFTAPSVPDANCGILTVNPNMPVQLIVTFSLASGTPKNLIYSILPRFTLDTAQGSQEVSPPQLANTLAFANANQFSCYGLQGTTFVQEVPSHVSWCV